MRMVRSSGEQLQGGKQRQEEGAGRYLRAPSRRSLGKSSTKELLETVKAPTEGRMAEQGQIMIILAARKDGHRTFHFWRFGKTANKRRFTDSLAAGAKRRHLWQAWKASRGCNTPPIRQGFFLFFPPHTKLTRSTLPTRPVQFRGLPPFTLSRKGKKNAGLSEGFPGHRSSS